MNTVKSEVPATYNTAAIAESIKLEKIVEKAIALLEKKYSATGRESINSAEAAVSLFKLKLLGDCEQFAVAFLDNQHNLISCEVMFRGTVNQAPVFPREIAKRALELNSAAIILSHNHPSGIAEPSRADKEITRVIKDALSLIDVRVLDHVIVASGDSYSFAGHGLM